MSRTSKTFITTLMIVAVATCAYAQEVPTRINHSLSESKNSLFEPKLETPTLTAPMFSDSLWWKEEIKLNGAQELIQRSPSITNNYHNSMAGEMWTWRGGALYGGSDDVSMIGLMRRQGVDLNVVQQYGDFTFRLTLSANRYMLPVDGRLGMMGMSARQNQFGIGGMITYDFNENLSTTVYGMYVSNPFYYTMAVFPYIPTSSYGGYITLHNDATGLDLGVNNHYDPFARRWQTDPIIRPTFKIGKVKTSIELGPAVKEGLLRMMGKRRSQGPIIMPSR